MEERERVGGRRKSGERVVGERVSVCVCVWGGGGSWR